MLAGIIALSVEIICFPMMTLRICIAAINVTHSSILKILEERGMSTRGFGAMIDRVRVLA